MSQYEHLTIYNASLDLLLYSDKMGKNSDLDVFCSRERIRDDAKDFPVDDICGNIADFFTETRGAYLSNCELRNIDRF